MTDRARPECEKNGLIAASLREAADILQAQRANRFRIRA
jgi:hypothetical protein